MTKLRKTAGWTFLLVACAGFVWLAFGEAHGQFSVTINGEQVEGAPKLLIGSVGFIVAGVATLAALGAAALAVVGSGFLIVCTLALVALILVAVAVPFLLPLVLLVALAVFILMLFRRAPRSKHHAKWLRNVRVSEGGRASTPNASAAVPRSPTAIRRASSADR